MPLPAGLGKIKILRKASNVKARAYSSVDEHPQLVKEEVDRLKRAKYMRSFATFAAVVAAYGQAVVSRIACLILCRALCLPQELADLDKNFTEYSV